MTLRVTVLMTTYNRCDITLRCLESLSVAIDRIASSSSRIILVDASSPDGTAATVRANYPSIEVVDASSNTYWASGMRQAWELAQENEYDVLIWLNDDVVLGEDALETLCTVSECMKNRAIVVGAFRDPSSGTVTYGGSLRGPILRRLSMTPVAPSADPEPIDAANGNLVWIPVAIDKALGGFPSDYTHGMADNAFTLGARRSGIPVLLAPGTLGTCRRNSLSGTWQDKSLPSQRRFRLLRSAKGLPFREYWKFCLRYGGLTGPLYAVKPYVTLALRGAGEAVAGCTHQLVGLLKR